MSPSLDWNFPKTMLYGWHMCRRLKGKDIGVVKIVLGKQKEQQKQKGKNKQTNKQNENNNNIKLDRIFNSVQFILK